MTYNTFQTSAQVLEWLISLSTPMIENGEAVQGTGICNIAVSESIVDTLLIGGGVIDERTEGKQAVYVFTRSGKTYTLKVIIAKSNMKRITFTWDHRTEEPTPEPDSVVETEAEIEMFKFFYRDLQGNTTLEMHPFEAINNYRMMDGEWLVWRAVNGLWKMIAQSKGWTSADVSEIMRRDLERRNYHGEIINGLLIERDGGVVRIYFASTKDPFFSSHLKIFQETHISLEGNVTHLNYAGFVKASTLAGTLLKMVEAFK